MHLAKILSWIFHPVFMPLIGVILILNSGIYASEIPMEFKRFIYAMVMLCSTVLPLTLFPALYLFKSLGKFTVSERQERIIPLLFTSICFLMGYFMMTRYSPVQLINLFLLSCAITALGALLVSLFWKICLHMAGIGGLIAMILVLSMTYTADMTLLFSVALLAAGIIASTRLALQAHSIYQVVAGFLLGFFLVSGTMFDYIRKGIMELVNKLL